VKSTELLLEQSRNLGLKRFVFISSVIVYDHTTAKSGMVFKEDMPYETETLTNYSRSKVEAEKIVLKYHSEHGMPCVIVRPAAIYGPGGPIYPNRLGFSIGAKRYLVIGDGKNAIPLSHVASVADAVWECIQKDSSTGKCYNAVEDGSITQNEFLQRVKELAIPGLSVLRMPYSLANFLAVLIQKGLGLVGQKSPLRLPYLKQCSTQYYYSNELAKSDLGWQPRADLVSSVDDTLKKYADERKPKRVVPLHRGKVIIPTDRRLNIAIVGCGMFADTHLSILKKLKNASVVALCDTDEKVREELVKKYGIPASYSDINEMLSGESVDVVHILTPAQSHAALSIAAMEKKCHVLVEKPMAVNAEEARKMIKVAQENNVKLCIDHNHLYDMVMIKARELIANKTIGHPAYVESWYGTAYSSNTRSRYMTYDGRDHWVYNLPGDLYQNMISHPI
jgi:nucleoside-diphosphate-sugar epimerase